VVGVVTTELELRSLKFLPSPSGNPGCHLSSASSIIFVSYLVCLLCETAIFALTLVKAISHLRRSRSPLVRVLYRDGILFYVYCMSFSLANILIAVAAPSRFKNWLASPEHIMHSICCTRVLLFIFQYRRKHDGTMPTMTAGKSTSLSSQFFTSFLVNNPTATLPEERPEQLTLANLNRRPHGAPTDITDIAEHRDDPLDMPNFQQGSSRGVSSSGQLQDDDEERGPYHDNLIILESRIP